MPHFGAPALLLLQLLAALPATAAETDATPLRFSVMESWSMPLVRLQRGQPIDGIVYDITRSLARQVGRKALYHPYPRGRIEQAMNAGEIDVRCYISPAWLSHDFPGYRWSVALLVQRDILVAREGFAPIPEALPAQRIGTVLGYSYPACKRCSTSADCAATMRAPRIWCWKSCAPAATATRSAINCRCTGATARRRGSRHSRKPRSSKRRR